jgi:hypothetical protein
MKLYNLEYWSNGKHIETVRRAVPYPVAIWERNRLTTTTHRNGCFVIARM